MPLTERISEVSKQIFEWLESRDESFNDLTDIVRLKKCEKSSKEYSYHYQILKRKND
jgi:hypothetical protein